MMIIAESRLNIKKEQQKNVEFLAHFRTFLAPLRVQSMF